MTIDELRKANDAAHSACIAARRAFCAELASRTSTRESRRAARIACEEAGRAALAASSAYASADIRTLL